MDTNGIIERIKELERLVAELTKKKVGASITPIIGETPSGTINGSNTAFTTANAYNTGTLAVYQNLGRLTSGVDFTPTAGGFTMTVAPITGDTLRVDYIKT